MNLHAKGKKGHNHGTVCGLKRECLLYSCKNYEIYLPINLVAGTLSACIVMYTFHCVVLVKSINASLVYSKWKLMKEESGRERERGGGGRCVTRTSC